MRNSQCVMRNIFNLPVVEYPQKYLDEIQEEIEIINAKIASGEQPVFDGVDAMIEKLEEN